MPNKDIKGDNTEIQYEPQRNDDAWQNAVLEHTNLGYSMFS